MAQGTKVTRWRGEERVDRKGSERRGREREKARGKGGGEDELRGCRVMVGAGYLRKCPKRHDTLTNVAIYFH